MLQQASFTTVEDYLAEPDVHEMEYQPMSGLLISAIYMIALTMAHGINVYLLFWLGTHWTVNLAIHIILSVIAGFAVLILKKMAFDTRFAMLAFVTSTAMSVMGAVGSFISLLQSVVYVRFRSSFEEWYQTIFPRGSYTNPEFIAEQIELKRDENPFNYSVMSFLEIIEIGSESQKREALTKMTTSFDPKFAPAFKRALVDDSSAIRVQAATSITRIENNFHERLLQIDDLHRQHPQNPVILKALAEHYDAYAFTGLLDVEREKVNREKAYDHYQGYLNLREDDRDVRAKIGRLLIRMKRHKEAANWLKRCLNEGYNNQVIKLWYIESLYHIGDYENLRKAATSYQVNLSDKNDPTSELSESIYLWSQAGAADQQTGGIV